MQGGRTWWDRDEMRREGACEVVVPRAEGPYDDEGRNLLLFIIIYYSWNGGRAEAVCAGEKKSENAMRRSNATACMV